MKQDAFEQEDGNAADSSDHRKRTPTQCQCAARKQCRKGSDGRTGCVQDGRECHYGQGGIGNVVEKRTQPDIADRFADQCQRQYPDQV